MTNSLRIAIADDERDTREFLHEAVLRLGHQVVAEAADGRKLAEQCRTTHPDLILADIRMPGLDGFEAAAEINKDHPTPVILISAYNDDATQARLGLETVMGYLTKPIKETDLKMAIAVARNRFQQFQAVSKEASDLRQALEDRKMIERAKGIVMRRLRVEEEEAFRRLRKFASDHNRRLIEVAQNVVSAEQIFQSLDSL
jgi:response regulator NasT